MRKSALVIYFPNSGVQRFLFHTLVFSTKALEICDTVSYSSMQLHCKRYGMNEKQWYMLFGSPAML